MDKTGTENTSIKWVKAGKKFRKMKKKKIMNFSVCTYKSQNLNGETFINSVFVKLSSNPPPLPPP